MQVILQERVAKLGKKWDVVKVKNGYARNYLLPRLLAVPANPKLIAIAQKMQEERLKNLDELLANAKELVKKLSEIEIKFVKKANKGKLYGSITEKDIAEALKKDHKIEIGSNMVKMQEHLKTIGSHKVNLHLTEDVNTAVKVVVEEEK